MKCPHCGAEIDDNSRFCYSCGKVFETFLRCPICENKIPKGDTTCSACGWIVNEADIPRILAEKQKSAQANISQNNETQLCPPPSLPTSHIYSNGNKTQDDQSVRNNGKTNNNKLFIIIGIAAVVIIITGVSLFLIFSKETKPTEPYLQPEEIATEAEDVTNASSESEIIEARPEICESYSSTTSTSNKYSGSHDFKGLIDGKYAITVHLDFVDNDSYEVRGYYYYDKNGPDATLRLEGVTESEYEMIIMEYNKKDVQTGTFLVQEVDDNLNKIEGYFRTNGKEMPFVWTKNTMIGNDDYGSFESSIFGFLSEREVTEDDLAGKNSEELRRMRNALYAKYGYIFKSQDLNEYFMQFPWYSEISTDVSSQLSSIEKRNVQIIKSYE